jgi:hypothetical protein
LFNATPLLQIVSADLVLYQLAFRGDKGITSDFQVDQPEPDTDDDGGRLIDLNKMGENKMNLKDL